MSVKGFFVPGILAVLAASLAAQDWAGIEGTPGPAAPARGSGGARTYGPSRPFVIGRDNLGFANPSGAVSIAGMAGNCYTMAEVSKLFYELADYQPAGTPPGFDPAAVADALRSPRYPAARFPVRGHASLFDASRPPADRDAEDWMNAATRRAGGLPLSGAQTALLQGPQPPNAGSLQALYEVITTIHYLHYVQYQGENLVEKVVKSKLGGAGAAPRVTRETVAQLEQALPRGELGVLLIFNADPAVTYGHVVLAYKVEETADRADVYIYDNNIQYGPERDESILRVEAGTGFYSLFRKRAADGAVVPDPTYAGSTWFTDRTKCSLSLLTDLRADPKLRETLARKLVHAAEEATYLVASGDLLKSLTTRSPRESPLSEDLRRFVLDLEAAQAKLGTRPSWRTRDLPRDASLAELGEYLYQYTGKALETIFPYALPEGLALRDTHLRLHRTDPNKARLETTIVMDPLTPLTRVVEAVRRSAVFAGDPDLARLVEGVGKSFEGEAITLGLVVDLEKGAAFDRRLGEYGPVPDLKQSHVVVGAIPPGTRDPREADHMIEISDRVAKTVSDRLLRDAGVLGTRYPFQYQVPLTGRKSGHLTLDAVEPDPQAGSLVVRARLHGFAGATNRPFSGEELGISFRTDPAVAAQLTVAKAAPKNVFDVGVRAVGRLQADDGLLGIGVKALSSLFDLVFPWLADGLAKGVRGPLAQAVALPSGSTIAFGPTWIRSAGGRVDLGSSTRPFQVDLGATTQKLFGPRAKVEFKDLRFLDDRLQLLLSNDR